MSILRLKRLLNSPKHQRKRNFVWEAECIVGLLKELNNKQLAGNLFIDLLKEFTDLTKQDIARELRISNDESSEEISKERQDIVIFYSQVVYNTNYTDMCLSLNYISGISPF